MDKETDKIEMDRCIRDPEYALWNYVHGVSDKQKAAWILASKYPMVRPKRGFYEFYDPLHVLRSLPQQLRPTGVVLASHYGARP